MNNRLLEGKLFTVLFGSVFRVVEIILRALHLGVRGVRLVVQRRLTPPLDARLAKVGKQRLASRARVDAGSILLITEHGEYGGDLKYIAEELLRRDAPCRITWTSSRGAVGPFPRELRYVERGTAEYFRAAASARVVLQEGEQLQRDGAAQSPGQVWLRADSGSSGEPAHPGHPRNDVLLDRTDETAARLRKSVLDRLGIPEAGQRFVLYAPARRGERRSSLLSGVDFAGMRRALAAKFGGEWEILVRTHPDDRKHAGAWLAGLPAYCRDASFYPDMQELLVASDAGITDASSWIDDYLLTGKPGFVFTGGRAGSAVVPAAADDGPVPVAASNRELVQAVKGFDEDEYAAKLKAYLASASSTDNGHSAERVVDHVLEILTA